MKRIIGLVIIISVTLAPYIIIGIIESWAMAFIVMGATIVVASLICLGMYLISE